MKLHLGCGVFYFKGWHNVDHNKGVKADAYFDIGKYPWPIADDSVDTIWCDQLLEHIPDTIGFMKEVYRVLKPGSSLEGRVPYACSTWAYIDPTHKVFFTERSFIFYQKNVPYGTQKFLSPGFSEVKVWLVGNTNTKLARLRNMIPFRNLLKWFLWNMYDNVGFKLTK